MHILLTGATGFLGSALLHQFIKDGYRISIVKRSASSLNRIKDVLNYVEVMDCGLVSFRDIFSKSDFDAVINTACCYGRNGESAVEILEGNLMFGVQLLQCCAERNTPFINTGSLLNPLVNEYALSKNQLEQWMGHFSGCCKSVTVKLDHIYGPGDDAQKFVGMLLTNFVKGTPEINLTKGDQTRDFIHINDVVDVFSRVLEKLTELKNRTVLVVGSRREISIKDFVLLVRNIWRDETGRECISKLNFGVLPYREHEIMRTIIEPVSIAGEPWEAKIVIEDGLKEYVRWFLNKGS